ncbi:MAG: helix-turn-helix domain-containing protein [Marinovum algicola]|uniref:helix-turn-helix domain-containing protein n=1 Tax=Roseobacteraceae TaxID=2854170 RepID=UPI0032EBF48F
MPKRLSSTDRQDILRLATEGLSNAEIAGRVGCSPRSVARIRARRAAVDRTTRGRILQVRVSAQEAEAFEALVAEAGLTTSGMLRHMIRVSAGVVAFRRDEVEVLRASSNQLNALARNLVQVLKLARAGKLTWNKRDAALVARLVNRTEEVARAVQGLRSASLRGSFVRVADVPDVPDLPEARRHG